MVCNLGCEEHLRGYTFYFWMIWLKGSSMDVGLQAFVMPEIPCNMMERQSDMFIKNPSNG